jgi:hypothetical protein
MNEKDITMLVQLREYVRKEFEKLDGKGNTMAMMKTSDAANTFASVVKSLDEVLKSRVTFQ